MTLIITRPDGLSRRVEGYRFAEPNARAPTFEGTLEKVPRTVDLRRELGAVRDQGEGAGSVALAAAVVYEHLRERHQGEATTASARFIEHNARKRSGEAEGLTIFDALSTLVDHGACSEQAFGGETPGREPPKRAYDEGAAFRASAVERVPVELLAWKRALAAGHPIVFGLFIYESFDRQRQPGLIPVPSDTDLEREQGEHALVCVGYCEADKVFIVRNAWGSTWGDEGDCYIPFDYVMDRELNRGDAWLVRGAETLPPNRATWGHKPVLEEQDTIFGQMTDAAWAALTDALGDVALETRLALIFLAAADADAELGEPTFGVVASALDDAFTRLGTPVEADRVLRNALPLIEDSALHDDSIVLIGEHLDEEALAELVRFAAVAAGLDDVAEVEEGTVAELVDTWLGGAVSRVGGLVDGLPGEYGDAGYEGGVYGDDDESEDDLGDGFGELGEDDD